MKTPDNELKTRQHTTDLKFKFQMGFKLEYQQCSDRPLGNFKIRIYLFRGFQKAEFHHKEEEILDLDLGLDIYIAEANQWL